MTMVVAQHCGLLPFGWTGVWLFYVLSGYVITRGFLHGDYAGSAAGVLVASWALFLRRRAVRIVPVYLLCLAVNIGVIAAVGQWSRLTDLPWLLSFLHNWHVIFGFWPGFGDWPPFGPLWTLSVEQQFYLLFPLLALAVAPRARVAVTVGLIAAGPLLRWAWSGWLAAGGFGGAFAGQPERLAFAVYAATFCHVDAFLLGSLIARLEPRWRAAPQHATRLAAIALAVAAAHALAYIALNRQLGAVGADALRNVYSGILWGQQREVFGYLAVDLLAAAALMHVLLGRAGTRLLAAAPVAWVGRVSYGGYLFHALVLWLVGHAVGGPVKGLPIGPRLLAFALVWAITVALASWSFRAFEQPLARRWRQPRRSPPRRLPQAAEALR